MHKITLKRKKAPNRGGKKKKQNEFNQMNLLEEEAWRRCMCIIPQGGIEKKKKNKLRANSF